MKIVIVGAKSIHNKNFLDSLPKQCEIHFISESQIDYPQVHTQGEFSFRSLNPIQWIINYRKLKRWIRDLSPHLIHIHQINRLAYFAARATSKLGIPIVSTSWGSDVLLMPKKNILFKFITKRTLERSACITANSNQMIQAMKEIHRHDSKYRWQQYGIAEVPELQQKEDLVFSNRLHEKLYNIDQIIQYFVAFKKAHPTWKLIVAGSGNETENLKRLVNQVNANDSIEFVGWLSPEENAMWYSKSKIYISIPQSDGTAISMLEALAHGCLPVLPNLPVTQEWIEDGKTGVIRKENSNPLFEAITLLDEDYANVNRAKIKTLAIRKECGQAYFELYKSLIHA